jgi:hypothetical protein
MQINKLQSENKVYILKQKAMKTILKITAVFVFVAFSSNLFALGNLKLNILPLSSEKAVVSITALSETNFVVSVADENDQIVYYKEYSEVPENYRSVFDFSNLENGNYKLVVVSNNLTTEREFIKNSKNIEVGAEKTSHKPFFTFEDNVLKLTYLNFMNDNLTIAFFDDNQLIYSKKIGSDFTINEGLDLSKLESGNYQAILYAGNKEYSYEIEK